MGDPHYEERRRMEKENEILRLRKEHARLTTDKVAAETAPIILQGLADFFSGRAHIRSIQDEWVFERNPDTQ